MRGGSIIRTSTHVPTAGQDRGYLHDELQVGTLELLREARRRRVIPFMKRRGRRQDSDPESLPLHGALVAVVAGLRWVLQKPLPVELRGFHVV